MNIQAKIDKLLIVLGQRGQFYKITSSLKYSDKLSKYTYKYMIMKPKEDDEDKFECVEQTYSKLDVLKYLVNEFNKGSEANE